VSREVEVGVVEGLAFNPLRSDRATTCLTSVSIICTRSINALFSARSLSTSDDEVCERAMSSSLTTGDSIPVC